MRLDDLKNNVSWGQTRGNLLLCESRSYRNWEGVKSLLYLPSRFARGISWESPIWEKSGFSGFRDGCGRLGQVQKILWQLTSLTPPPAPGGLKWTLIWLSTGCRTCYSTSVVAVAVFPQAANDGNPNFRFEKTGCLRLHPSECCDLSMQNKCFVVVNVVWLCL